MKSRGHHPSTVPKVSVCVSTLNEIADGALSDGSDSTLSKALISVLKQTMRPLEIVIVADATLYFDRIESLIRLLKTRSGSAGVEFILVNQQERGSPYYPGYRCKQRALTIASAEIIAFLDADNRYGSADHLARSVDILRHKRNVSMVYCDSKVVLKNKGYFGGASWVWQKPEWSNRRKNRLLRSNFIDTSEAVIRKAACLQAGGICEDIPYAVDWSLWRRMVLSGAVFARSAHVGLEYQTDSWVHHGAYWILSRIEKWHLPFYLGAFLRLFHWALALKVGRKQRF